MRTFIKFIFSALVALVLYGVSPVEAQTVVTLPQGGTITFCETRTQGTYANGDPYVVVGAGVTICDRSTKDVDGIAPTLHGCEVNPEVQTGVTSISNAFNQGSVSQGWDSRFNNASYDGSENVCASFPSASIPAGSSIVVATSLATPGSTGGDGTVQPLYSLDVVTIVSAAPACGNACAFRPPWAGTNKAVISSSLTKSSIAYSVLNNWVSQGALPTAASVVSAGYFRKIRPTISMSGSTNYRSMVPSNHKPGGSGGGYAMAWNQALGRGMIALNRSDTNANKEALAVQMIQIGIDMYGQTLAGQWWTNSGGHSLAARELMLFAASLLQDSTMMDYVVAQGVGSNFQRHMGNYMFHYVSQNDVNLTRFAGCGSNDSTAPYDTSRCAPFTSSNPNMIGRSQGHWTLGTWMTSPQNATALDAQEYLWVSSGFVSAAMVLQEMGLEAEYGHPEWFDHLLSRDPAGSGTKWEDNRYAGKYVGTAGHCLGAPSGTNHAISAEACEVWNVHLAGAGTDGSVGGGGPQPNQPPVFTLSGASTRTTSSATSVITGASTDSDGTVSSTTAVATCDASTTNTGSAASPSFTVDLPLNTPCTLTITATDDDADASSSVAVLLFRHSADCTSLMDSFAIASGTWPTLNPGCWVTMAGSIALTNNNAVVTTAGRSFSYYNQAIADDQQASITLGATPASGSFYFTGVRGGAPTPGTLYTGVSCSAESTGSVIAKYTVSGSTVTRTPLSGTISASWVQGDAFSCQVVGQQYCVLQNGVSRGCATDAQSSYTGGFTFAGGWSTAAPFDDFVATSASGGGDITNPLVAFTVPATPIQVGTTPYTAAAGTATDAVGITAGTWLLVETPAENGTLGGTALPSTNVSWVIASIDLIEGDNTIQVTVQDAAGHMVTTSQVVTYIPAVTVTGTLTRPNAETTSTQVGLIIHLEGTFTAGQCTSVLLTNVSNPNPEIGGNSFVATGTTTWVARVGLVLGLNTIEIACMDGANGTGNVVGTPLTKIVNSVPTRTRLL